MFQTFKICEIIGTAGVQKKDVVNWLFSRDVKFAYDLTTLEIFMLTPCQLISVLADSFLVSNFGNLQGS